MKPTTFHQFIKNFNEKIKKHQAGSDPKSINLTIKQGLELIFTYYLEDFSRIIHQKSILKNLNKMERLIDLKNSNIAAYSLINSLNIIQIRFSNGHVFHSSLIPLRESLKTYFSLTEEDPFFWAISAYLAEDSRFNLIQLYNALYGDK